MDESTESKQAFLRETILDKNHDPEDFLNYLISIKGNLAGNVEIWTMEELKEATYKYLENNSCSEKNDTNQNTSINTEYYNNSKSGEYKEIITCKKQDKSLLSEMKNILVKVNEYIFIT